MRRRWLAYWGCAVAALLLATSPVSAQDDPPGRVARLGYIRGNVSFQPAGTDDWIEAGVNRPLTTGDGLWSDSGSRAALHIASASINLSENTGFTFLNLADNGVQIQLSSGALRIRVKWLDENENFEVDTPNLAFSILRPGIYKISVNPAGDTTVIEDRRGEGEVTGGGAAYTIHAGDVGAFFGTNQLSADVQYLNGSSSDDFERWCEQRDHHEDVSISARYVSNDAIGYDDLDDNGGWRQTEYGMVWFPYVTTAGWAPYHYGHWAYVSPWGYTWVDDAPWGFAPFHYGRWINAGGAWGWVPCPPRPPHVAGAYVRPVYAPALVAWIGGPHFGIGVTVGSGVGWFPLGPREVYVPSYPVSRRYMNNVNVSNTVVNTTVVNNYYTNVVVNKTVNVTNVTYVNQRVAGAVAVTSPQAFSSGQSVSRNAVRVDARQIAAAPVNSMTPAAVPQRAAVQGGRAVANVRPPAAIQARTVVVKTAPPPPPPTFANRQAAMQSNGGRPLSIVEARQIAPVRAQTVAAPQIRIAPPARPVEPRMAPEAKAAAAANPNSPNLNAPNPNSPNPNGPGSTQAARPAVPVNNTVHSGMRPVTPPAPVRPQPPVTPQPPPSAYPQDERLEKQHQQQVVNLRQQQDEERQKLEQQHQQQQAQQLQRQADAAKVQQAEEQRQQQMHALEQKQQQQQQQLEQRQEAQHRAQQQQAEVKEKPQPKEKEKEKPKDGKPPLQ